MNIAFLVIDLQQNFFKKGRLRQHRARLAKNVIALTDAAHSHDVPIIWVRQEHKADLSDAPLYNREHRLAITIKGTSGCKLLPELHRHTGNHEIVKKRYSAFFRTRLESLLKKLRVDTILIAGINTMSCVRMTAVDAYQRDLHVILAVDAVDAYDARQHRDSLVYLQHAIAIGMSNAQILRLFKSS